MKLLFIGFTPEPPLRQAFVAANYEISSYPTSQLSKRKDTADIVVVKVGAQNSLGLLDTARKKFPVSWLVALIDRHKLLAPEFHTALLQNRAKDDVWLDPDWRDELWLLLQRATLTTVLRRNSIELSQEFSRLAKEYRELTNHSKRLVEQIERDVNLATSIQRTLLPKVSPGIPGISMAIKYFPATGLGGDYYDIFELGDKRRFGILLADSKSHGMAALLLSALIRVRTDEVKTRFPKSNLLLEFINREIETSHAAEYSSLSLLYGILDRSTLQFNYSSAGHLTPMLWRDGERQKLESPPCPAIGGLDRFDFPENQITLRPGDLLFFHTDGLEKCVGKRFPQVAEKLFKHKTYPVDPIELQNEIMGLIDRFTHGPRKLEDDITIIQLSVQPKTLYLALENDSKD